MDNCDYELLLDKKEALPLTELEKKKTKGEMELINRLSTLKKQEKQDSDDSYEEVKDYTELFEKRRVERRASRKDSKKGIVKQVDLKKDSNGATIKKGTTFSGLRGTSQGFSLDEMVESSRFEEIDGTTVRLPWYLFNPSGTFWILWEYTVTLLLVGCINTSFTFCSSLPTKSVSLTKTSILRGTS